MPSRHSGTVYGRLGLAYFLSHNVLFDGYMVGLYGINEKEPVPLEKLPALLAMHTAV